MVCLSLLAIPSVSLGIILVKIFNRPFLETIYTSFWIIVVGFLIRFFPYSAEILNVFWAQIDAKLLEVAKLTGAPFWQVLRRILIPLLLPGLLVAWITTFILSLGELGITLLVYPSGYQTLPIRIFTLLHYGAPELVAALSIILIVLILLATLVGSFAVSPSWRRFSSKIFLDLRQPRTLSFLLMDLLTPSRLRVLSSVFSNLAAAWIGAIFIIPNFTDFSQLTDKLILTVDFLAAILCLVSAFKLEETAETCHERYR